MDTKNILVVDDSISNLLLIKDILSSNPEYNVICEKDGDKVLQQLDANRIDLMLLDIMMPRTDGYEVCRHVKEDAGFKDIPIIFLTAKVDEASLLRGFECGAVDYIKKPFLISELMARVKTHITLKKTNEKLKNELFKHSITQQSLLVSQNELTIRNNIAHYFLSDKGDEVYPKLLEEVLKYVSMDYGAIGYFDSMPGGDGTEARQLVCPAIYSGAIESDKNYTFAIEDIGDVALAAIRRQTIIQKNKVSRLFFTNAEVSCMIASPIIYHDKLIGLIACASRENDYAEKSRQKLQSISSFIAPAIYNRIYDASGTASLVKTITETQEQERTRFVKDIHDGIGSYLTTLTTYISILRSGVLDEHEAGGMLDDMSNIVIEMANEARNIANNHPPAILEKLGLVESIKFQFGRLYVKDVKTTLNFVHSGYAAQEPLSVRTELYHIACELINNAYKYSHAARIDIALETDGESVSLRYRDDGVGFDMDDTMQRIKGKRSSGLINIHERVDKLHGTITLVSEPKKGTCLELTLKA